MKSPMMSYFASPDSTVAPSSRGSRWGSWSNSSDDVSCDAGYLELPLSAGEPTTSKFTSLKLGLLASLSVNAVFFFGLTFFFDVRDTVQKTKPKIWKPDIRREFLTEPLAKSVIRKFDAYNMARGGLDDSKTFLANVHQYMSPDLVYESVGFGTWQTPEGWNQGEEGRYGAAFPETVFTQMIFFGDEQVATTTTYGSALWGGDLFNIKAPNKWVTLRITDFYNIQHKAPGSGRISYNFMMIDWADALRQIGRRMLPQPPLEEGLVLPPSANDGVPAPLSVLVQAEHRDALTARAVAEAALQHDWTGSATSVQNWHDNLTYYGPGGIGLARNLSDYKKHVVGPFRTAFVERTAVVELSACEGNYCGLFGRLSARGVGKWLGLPTAGKSVSFRFAMHYRVVENKVQEGWTIFDFPGLFTDLGLDFYKIASEGGRYPDKSLQ